MAPYKLIKGSDKNLAAFEEQIANAMLDGYELANDLVVFPKASSNGEEVLLFQAMICDEILEYDDEEEDDDEDDEEFED